MRSIDQKGFTLVECLLSVIALTLVAGVGFYIKDSLIKSNKLNTQSSPTAGNSQAAVKEEVKDTRLTLSDHNFPFTFKYPADWTSFVELQDASVLATITAPGTTKDSSVAYNSILDGAEIRVLSYSEVAKNMTDLKANLTKEGLAKNQKDLTIDSVYAVGFDITHEGPAIHTVVFFKNGHTYSISIQKDLLDAGYQKTFSDLLSSVKFN